MSDQISFTVRPELLSTLGTLAGTPVSSISPYNYGKDAPARAEAIAALADLGICDAKGNPVPDKKEAVAALARTDAFTRIYLTTQDRVTEYIAYFAPGGAIAGITNDSGMQLVTFPAANDAMLEQVRQMIGFSIYRNGSFEAHLTRAETLVLSAMIDLQRKEMLHKFSEGAVAGVVTHTPGTISAMLETEPGNYQWFTSAFLDLFTSEHAPAFGTIPKILDALSADGLAVQKDGGYTLSDEGVILARGHLLPAMYLTMTSGKATASEKTNAAGFSCIISGIHDLLYIDYEGDDIELRTVASAEIHDLLSVFLNNPGVLARLDPASASAKASMATPPAKKFCPSCGAALKTGRKFCYNCGAKVA